MCALGCFNLPRTAISVQLLAQRTNLKVSRLQPSLHGVDLESDQQHNPETNQNRNHGGNVLSDGEAVNAEQTNIQSRHSESIAIEEPCQKLVENADERFQSSRRVPLIGPFSRRCKICDGHCRDTEGHKIDGGTVMPFMTAMPFCGDSVQI